MFGILFLASSASYFKKTFLCSPLWIITALGNNAGCASTGYKWPTITAGF